MRLCELVCSKVQVELILQTWNRHKVSQTVATYTQRTYKISKDPILKKMILKFTLILYML
jgi:hypothetical protein